MQATQQAAAAPELSDVEQRHQAYEKRKLAVERTNLKKEIDRMTADFDSQVEALLLEQLKVQAEVKAGEVKLIVMDRELTMLKVSGQEHV